MEPSNKIACRIRMLSLCLAGWAVFSVPASPQDVLYRKIGWPGDSAGYWGGFRAIGDVNADGVNDFCGGLPGYNRHVVVSGADWSELSSVVVPNVNLYHADHGEWVTGIGDWNGDGVPDYAVGAPGHSPNAPAIEWEGIVRLYSGADHSLIQEIAHHIDHQSLGRRLFGLGDITGDGLPELVVQGSPLAGFLWFYSAPNATLLRVEPSGGDQDLHPFPDLDGDGATDYILQNPHYGTVGGVIVRSGATGEELLECRGRRFQEGAGSSLAPAGDWNADGREDIVGGAPGSMSLGESGRPMGVYVWDGTNGHILRFFEGLDYVPDGSNFGFDVDSGKDVNGDGFPDLIVGAPAYSDIAGGGGAAFVISGRTGAMLWKHYGTDLQQQVGWQVSFLDDHDGDGLAEWIINTPEDRSYMNQPWGSVTIFRGAVGDRWNACGTNDTSASAPTARLFAAGPISLRENMLQLSVESAPPSTVGLFLSGTPVPAAPFGAGRLCLGGQQLMLSVALTDAVGNAWISVNLNGPPFGVGPGSIAAGETHAFQFVYRVAATGERDASDSVVIRFLP